MGRGNGWVRLGGGNGEGEGGNEKGEMGREQQEGGDGEGGKGEGERRGKRRGDFTDGYEEMPGWTYGMPEWNEVTEFSDFVYPCNAGYPSKSHDKCRPPERKAVYINDYSSCRLQFVIYLLHSFILQFS